MHHFGRIMGPKRKLTFAHRLSPEVKQTKVISQKCKRGKRMSPGKSERVRKALFDVCKNTMSLRKASREYDLSYSFLQRRCSGEVDIDSINGPSSVFTQAEEEAFAVWLSEMALRGMGLRPCEFLDFIQSIVVKEQRKTPFKDDRPGFGWYTSFMSRNKHLVSLKPETQLELCRSKVTKDRTDKWYACFKGFLIRKNLIDKPSRIWNADETGFSMGSNKSKVIGPARVSRVPHITAGKERLTVMYCGSASGQMMPPFFVFPEPKPRGYNPLTGSTEGSEIAYTKKGWMNTLSFSKFIDHFDKHAGTERLVTLLIDSVSSHIDISLFTEAKMKGIELYRIVPNVTHLMQPLDKGVFGPLKSKWHLTVRKHSRENPGRSITRENFAEKLTEAFLLFYKPLTVINAFKSSGIYPVDSNAISSEALKPALTFASESTRLAEQHKSGECIPANETTASEQYKAEGALEALERALATPVRRKYKDRVVEGYDVQESSPCFEVYKKLYSKAHPRTTDVSEQTENSALKGLDLLASTVLSLGIGHHNIETNREETTQAVGIDLEMVVSGTSNSDSYLSPDLDVSKSSTDISPAVSEALVYPKLHAGNKTKRRRILEDLPDNLTSEDTIRKMSLRELEKIKTFAEREKKSKSCYYKKMKTK
ncbi:JERKL-like protein [Mya arenaria]|uniref:JERKL-like protein n=1 Tax=Mya arenaria TaxID=6604 RepID=A0ABY7DP40_MYAAR|nr:uncharacterized protein LOC128228012 [Mya arenaria]WAQ98492.1 JERKL-like protein [Mya arenaria]